MIIFINFVDLSDSGHSTTTKTSRTSTTERAGALELMASIGDVNAQKHLLQAQ